MTDDDALPPIVDSGLSDGQQIAQHVITFFSATLSVVGSSMIVFKIIRDRAETGSTSPYDRFMLLLSSSDILSSIAYAIDPFLYPTETGLAWAFGNTTGSCRTNGFLKSFTVIWAVWNNGTLSYYFLLTVLSQLRRTNYVRMCEPFLHLSGLLFPITAILGLFLGWYEEEFPCLMDYKIGYWHAVAPTFFVLLSLIVNNVVIYAALRKSLRLSEQVASPAQKRLTKEAATLMFLYVGAFFATVSPTLLVRFLEDFFGYQTGDKKSSIYPVLVLRSLLLPLQGCFNFLIYIKPSYARFHAAYPDQPMWFVLKQALFNPNVPNFTSETRQSADDAASATNPNHTLFRSSFRPRSSSSDVSSSMDPSSSHFSSRPLAAEDAGIILVVSDPKSQEEQSCDAMDATEEAR